MRIVECRLHMLINYLEETRFEGGKHFNDKTKDIGVEWLL